ncbi:MAG: hypothetical protein E7586_05115 [Ruminococcaceae bacterium]|nr:hypothetical protein [Oscillospiraceae bacterium]
MYSRDFGGIKSDGQLYNFEREYNQSREREYNQPQGYGDFSPREESAEYPEKTKTKGPLDFLRHLEIDDLILIGIGILLLLDSEEENDIFVLIIALMLLF